MLARQLSHLGSKGANICEITFRSPTHTSRATTCIHRHTHQLIHKTNRCAMLSMRALANSTRRRRIIAVSVANSPERTRRRYATARDDLELLEGRSEGTVSAMWRKYKVYALGAGGAVAAMAFMGVAASAIAVTSLVGLAGGAYWWYKGAVKHRQTVLRALYEPIIEDNRVRIEKYLGPFELPAHTEIAADTDIATTPSGYDETIVRNIFYMEGKFGKGLVRVLGAKDSETGEYNLRKLIIDAQDFRNGAAERFELVSVQPKIEYVDSPKFEVFSSISAYTSQVAKNRLEAAQESKERRQRIAAKVDRLKKSKSTSNKNSKASSDT